MILGDQQQVPSGTPHIVISIMARPERYERIFPICVEHNADFIALMWGPEEPAPG